MKIRYVTVAPTGEIFVARFRGDTYDVLIDVCGPITQRECTEANLAGVWDFSTEDADFVYGNMSGVIQRPFPGDLTE